MTSVIHLGSTIETVLGVIDSDGNLVRQFTVRSNPNNPDCPLHLKRLSSEAFEAALKAIIAARHDLEEQTCQTS